eukprot:365048-Chlamydomonas_euryale.AAC.23
MPPPAGVCPGPGCGIACGWPCDKGGAGGGDGATSFLWLELLPVASTTMRTTSITTVIPAQQPHGGDQAACIP